VTARAASKDEAMRERRCIVTGEVRSEDRLVRFVVGPDGEIVPDIATELPGRGIWVTAERAILERAVAGKEFARAAKGAVKVAPDLALRVERLLAGRVRSDLGLARRAGLIACGFDNVMRVLKAKPPRILLEASDGAAEGRRKLAAAIATRGLRVETIDWLTQAELSLALGRENVIHAAVGPGPLAERLICDSARLKGFRPAAEGAAGSSPVRNEKDA
jgi:predicted RNA-binding protein YlxR (DUF448 family)